MKYLATVFDCDELLFRVDYLCKPSQHCTASLLKALSQASLHGELTCYSFRKELPIIFFCHYDMRLARYPKRNNWNCRICKDKMSKQTKICIQIQRRERASVGVSRASNQRGRAIITLICIMQLFISDEPGPSDAKKTIINMRHRESERVRE